MLRQLKRYYITSITGNKVICLLLKEINLISWRADIGSGETKTTISETTVKCHFGDCDKYKSFLLKEIIMTENKRCRIKRMIL